MEETMTVKELKEELAFMPDDADVQFCYNYGDHWRTTVAAEINHVEEGAVTFSDYHRMDKVVDEDDDDGDCNPNIRKVVLLT
jgi:hypothetical protein